MPATSERQRRAAGAAYAVAKGDRPASSLKGPARRMLSGMTRSQLRHFAGGVQKTNPAGTITSGFVWHLIPKG